MIRVPRSAIQNQEISKSENARSAAICCCSKHHHQTSLDGGKQYADTRGQTRRLEGDLSLSVLVVRLRLKFCVEARKVLRWTAAWLLWIEVRHIQCSDECGTLERGREPKPEGLLRLCF